MERPFLIRINLLQKRPTPVQRKSASPLVRFWHWSATWNWYELLFLGGFGLSLAIHEYAISIVFLGFSALGAISKVSHNTRSGLLTKCAWIFVIIFLLLYLGFDAVQEKDDREWSWTAPELRGLMPEKMISKYWQPPSFPPDYSNLEAPAVQSEKPPSKVSPELTPQNKNTELALELAGRGGLMLELANTTVSTADKPKYWFAMLDATNCFVWPTKPEDCQPLPLQTQTYASDYVNGLDRLGPFDVLSQSPSEIAKQFVKSGDVLVGIVGVTCFNCMEARRYYVYFKVGEGGWFSRMEPGYKFPALTKNIPDDQLQKFLDAQVPQDKRTIIPETFDITRSTRKLP